MSVRAVSSYNAEVEVDVEARYTVNLLASVPEAVRTTVALQLAEKFNVSIAKMNRLLKNNQGPITKPISERDAKKIAKVLGRAGIEVAVVRSDLDAMLLIEDPIVSAQDKQELQDILSGTPKRELPQAARLEDPAFEGKVTRPPQITSSGTQLPVTTTPETTTPETTAELPVPQTFLTETSGTHFVTQSDTQTPADFTPATTKVGRPVLVAALSLLFVVLTVAFGVSFMLPERPLLPGEVQTPFEEALDASITGDYPKAVALWQTLADEGDSQAQFELAWLYTTGLGTEKNLERAAFYFNKAAESGHAESQHKLGQLFLYGQGVTQSYSEALRWFTAAAEQGQGEAQLLLGQLYLRGEGTDINLPEADKWLHLAAKQGVPGASETLAELQRLQAVASVATRGADMFAAVEKNDPQAVIGAVLAGADVNARSEDGYTPLMYAVALGNPEVVREVLSGGADINAQSTTGWTALMFAAKDRPQLLEQLLEAGADKTLKNSTGQTAYDVALVSHPPSAPLLQ
jgi:TPR repeat protein